MAAPTDLRASVISEVQDLIAGRVKDMIVEIDHLIYEVENAEGCVKKLDKYGLDADFLYPLTLMPSHVCHEPDSGFYELDCAHVVAAREERAHVRASLPSLEELKVTHREQLATAKQELADARARLVILQELTVS